MTQTTPRHPLTNGPFGFAAMFRAGAYSPEDAERVARKFEELGMALSDAQACLLGDTPERGTPDEARAEVLANIRKALNV